MSPSNHSSSVSGDSMSLTCDNSDDRKCMGVGVDNDADVVHIPGGI